MRTKYTNIMLSCGLILVLAGCGIQGSQSAAVSKIVAGNNNSPASDRADRGNLDVVGISVVKPDPNNKFGGSSVPGLQPGTTIHLRIRDASRNFITVKSDSSIQLAARGKTLTEKSSTNFGFMAQISDDGHTCTIPIHGEHLPPARSNALDVKGKVGLVAASDPTTDIQVFALKKGSKLKLAGMPVEISELGKPWQDDYAVQVQFQAKQPFDAIQNIDFFDESDQPIKSAPSGRTNFGINGSYTYSIGYSLKRKPAKLKAEVTYFQYTEDIEIPVDFQVGLGVAGP